MAEQNFDISKYITTQDVVAAVAAGTIAYLTYKTKQDEPAPGQPQGQAGQPTQAEATGLSSTHRELPTTNANQHMIAGFDEEGYMHDCDMMIGNKRVLAVLDKEGNVTSWLDKNGNPFKFANPDQQSRYEYFMKQVAGVNGKQPTFKGSFEEFLAQSNPSGGAAGASVAASATTPTVSTDINLPTGGYATRNFISNMSAADATATQSTLAAQIYNISGKTISYTDSHSAMMDVFSFAEQNNMSEDGVRRLLNALGTKGIKKLIHLDQYSDDLDAVDNMLANVAKAAGVI